MPTCVPMYVFIYVCEYVHLYYLSTFKVIFLKGKENDHRIF